ncbi:hypothetical protein FRC14_005896 [Serendipita sp. 396]|nr:hypothetical protein FRC14_005896 [Serendipita sp. 396]KAG8780291.1 hypothetical protein FRC15_009637 [Serendipita sp. 397]KAG8796823.1 hypothetical protein FRC16_009491 [Serendipita sp. 398]KAG8826475.1 hypothetical protein FRC19_008829 [Serendipita sp. 401]KAG8867509.1 hypothetical protein FRC20_005576 [Serendipita sp. 405]KAG9057325.1 hypothetical protein FS842_007464 [Serendipita sp. 407]
MNGQHAMDEMRLTGSSKALALLNGSNNTENGDRAPEVDRQLAEERTHADNTVSHIYESGFKHGNFSDINVQIGTTVYRLHALILSKSPFLVHLMSISPFKGMIYMPIDQYPDVTLEAMAMTLGYLYSYQASRSLSQANARAVLASACLLGGLDDLCERAYATCKDSIRVDTIEEWLAWIDAHPSPLAHSPSASAVSTPRSPSPQSSQEGPGPSIYGPYAQLLRNDVLDFLVVSLPTTLLTENESNKSEATAEATEALLRIFSRVSFDIFKSAMESPNFVIGSDHDRFRFAKAAIARRKQFAGRGAEESVVLAVGEGKGNVHITRKLRRKALWKVAK